MPADDPLECAREGGPCRPPAEAVALLGNETRVRILEALWRAEDPPVRFARLLEAVAVQDSARFDYHLQKLVGTYVRATDAGYRLRRAGKHVVRGIVAGSIVADPEHGPFETGDACTACGAQLLAEHAEGRLAIACPGCGTDHGAFDFPAGVLLDRQPDEVLAAFDDWVRQRHRLAMDGVCPSCAGPVEARVRAEDDGLADRALQLGCHACPWRLETTLGRALWATGALAAHRPAAGDGDGPAFWALDWCVTDEDARIAARDPLTVVKRVDGAEVALEATEGAGLAAGSTA
jgi:hypothetical protein